MAVFADTSVSWVPQLKKVGVICPCTTFSVLDLCHGRIGMCFLGCHHHQCSYDRLDERKKMLVFLLCTGCSQLTSCKSQNLKSQNLQGVGGLILVCS
jgi:hypothetical protein